MPTFAIPHFWVGNVSWRSREAKHEPGRLNYCHCNTTGSLKGVNKEKSRPFTDSAELGSRNVPNIRSLLILWFWFFLTLGNHSNTSGPHWNSNLLFDNALDYSPRMESLLRTVHTCSFKNIALWVQRSSNPFRFMRISNELSTGFRMKLFHTRCSQVIQPKLAKLISWYSCAMVKRIARHFKTFVSLSQTPHL